MLTNSPPDGSVKGALVAIDSTGWHIGYALTKGQNVYRNNQYTIFDGPIIDGAIKWRRLSRTHNNLQMLGELRDDDQDMAHFYYVEWLWDYGQGGKLVVHTQADCKRVIDHASMTPYAPGPYAGSALANAAQSPAGSAAEAIATDQ